MRLGLEVGDGLGLLGRRGCWWLGVGIAGTTNVG
jgi:hypothetical protein